jgi:hypothetical protein
VPHPQRRGVCDVRVGISAKGCTAARYTWAAGQTGASVPTWVGASEARIPKLTSQRTRHEVIQPAEGGLLLADPPHPPGRVECNKLKRERAKIFGFKGLIDKIFRTKDLASGGSVAERYAPAS